MNKETVSRLEIVLKNGKKKSKQKYSALIRKTVGLHLDHSRYMEAKSSSFDQRKHVI